MASHAAVCAGHALTAQAAEQVLREGGNAFDAAIAAFFTACVAEPVLASLGGGGFLLARTAERRTALFDFFVHTPRRRDATHGVDFEPVTVDFGSATQEFHIGYGAIATPGCVRGMFEVHRQLGAMPMAEIVQPAIEAAREGVRVSDFQATIFSVVEPIYVRHDSSRACFESPRRPGRVVGPGDTLRWPQLADTLELLAIEGEDLFYRGEIARLIEAEVQAGGGYLTYDDLARYEAVVRKPLRVAYHGATVFTNPPPSAGGCLAAFALGLLEGERVAALGFGARAHLGLLAEVMDLTNAARVEAMPDVGCGAPDAERLFDPELLARYRAEVRERTLAPRGTTHLNTIDAAGNVASLTVSNGEGCGHILPGTGIMLNNMLGEEDLSPHGFHRWRPDERMSSMMMPSIAELADGRLLATGSGGSNRIRTAVLQVLVNVIDFRLDVEEAVCRPRIHFENDVLYAEGGFAEAEMAALLARHPQHKLWPGHNIFFGGAHTLMRDGARVWGVGDPRRGGVCHVVAT